MINYGWGGGMMGGGGTWGFLAVITWAAWTAVGVLLAVWLWKQINK